MGAGIADIGVIPLVLRVEEQKCLVRLFMLMIVMVLFCATVSLAAGFISRDINVVTIHPPPPPPVNKQTLLRRRKWNVSKPEFSFQALFGIT